MAGPITKIHVTACDNELYILASQSPVGSTEICHIKSGFNNPVEYLVNPQSILPHGNYTLIMVGINWGGPQAFHVTLTDAGNIVTTHTAPTNAPVGATWTVAVPITVSVRAVLTENLGDTLSEREAEKPLARGRDPRGSVFRQVSPQPAKRRSAVSRAIRPTAFAAKCDDKIATIISYTQARML